MNHQRNTISAHQKIKHLTKKYRRFRYLKDKGKRIDLDQVFKSRSNRKETLNKELNFSNFFSKLNQLNKKKDDLSDDLNSSTVEDEDEIAKQITSSDAVPCSLPLASEDSENHLLELIKASSTITTNNRTQRNNQTECTIDRLASTSAANQQSTISTSKKESKKSSAAKHKEKSISLLNELNRFEATCKEHRIVNEDILIEYFLNKIKECLTKDEQVTFLGYLEEFDSIHRKLIERTVNKSIEQNGSNNKREDTDLNDELKQVYSKIKQLINETNSDSLVDEFLLFMNYELVKQLNREFDFNYWIKVKSFVQKIVIYLNQDCGSLIRLLKLLKQLKQNENDLDKKRIRTVLSKFLNSQPYLLNELNTLFLEEQPQDHYFAFSEDFDEIDLEEEINVQQHQTKENHHQAIKFESVNLGELVGEELDYSTEQCPCKFCHHHHHNQPSESTILPTADTLDSQFKHCISCSLKYFKNKVYCSENQKLNFTSIEYIEDG